MLEVKNVKVRYDEIEVIHDVSLTVQDQEIVCIVGSNGAGKTSLLNTICGLKKPSHGQIIFESENITNLNCHERVEKGIVLVPEGRRLFPYLTVKENLELGAYSKNARKQISENLGRVYSLFPRLKEREKQMAGSLSGGEQQMVAIARGLMANPKILILDEPSVGLAPIIIKRVFKTIKEINQMGTTILLVEQNVNASLQLGDRFYVLENGCMSLTGKAQDLVHNEHVKKAYLSI